jgi:hypothetical protein
MGLPHSLQDTNWNVTIPASLWKDMSPPCGTGTIKQFNFGVQAVGSHRKLQLTELEEKRNNAYDSSKIYKEKTKAFHD